MKRVNIVVPAVVTAFLTALAIFSSIWLTGLVPEGQWSSLIKAGIVIFIIGSTLLIIAWSAYFTYVIRKSLREDSRQSQKKD
jgi:hypothetical protein